MSKQEKMHKQGQNLKILFGFPAILPPFTSSASSAATCFLYHRASLTPPFASYGPVGKHVVIDTSYLIWI